MNIKVYFQNIYFQFYSKADEANYFLHSSCDIYDEYISLPIPRDVKYLSKLQFNFSAFLSSLESCWEIVKVSIDLKNQFLDLKIPRISEKDFLEFDKFSLFFNNTDTEIHNLFIFMKDARNASIHDGSINLNGGSTEKFYFMTGLCRFIKGKNGEFTFSYTKPPTDDAISVMIKMALKLLPLFESKLEKPNLTYEEHRESILDKINSVTILPFSIPDNIIEQILPSLIEQEKKISDTKHEYISKNIECWKILLDKYS
jgi:hypothetical protein